MLGHVDLVIKVYRGSQHPNFPEGGKMSQHLEGLEFGDMVEFKGPVGHFEYLGRGEYLLNRKRCSTGAISLIAGGTGITPCWQVGEWDGARWVVWLARGPHEHVSDTTRFLGFLHAWDMT